MAFAPSLSPYRAIPEYLDPPALLTATAPRFTGLTALLCGLLPLHGEMLLFDPFLYLAWSGRDWEGMFWGGGDDGGKGLCLISPKHSI